jgi:two-component system sensor kinase FixL
MPREEDAVLSLRTESISMLVATLESAGGIALVAVLCFLWKRWRYRERALADALGRLGVLSASADVALWEVDLRTRSVWTTDNYARIAGVREGTSPSRHAAAPPVYPDERARAISEFTGELAQETPIEGEYRVIGPGGAVRWVRRRGRVVRDRRGVPSRLRGVLVDVTAGKLAEQRAREQRHQLAHLGRVSMLGELAGTLAHELSQPLTAIRVNVEVARRMVDHASPLSPELDHILREILRDDQRAGAVIHRLRALLRKSEPQRQEMDLTTAVHEVLAIVRADLVAREIRVAMLLAPDIPIVTADRVQLQQVVLNLVLNAADAMSSRPPDARRLTLTTSVVGDDVLLEVSDTGTGVPADRLQRIFEPFETTKGGGLGLGLSICRSIVVDHGGRLWAENNSGHGATFLVSLPVARSRTREGVVETVVVRGDLAETGSPRSRPLADAFPPTPS